MSFDWSIFDGYEQNFVPEQQGFRPGLDGLPDGCYDFEIVDAEPSSIKGDPVIRVGLRVGGGAMVERLYWCGTQEGFNAFGADLCIFGIPADQWKAQGKKMSDAVAEALPRLIGVKFKGNKRSYKKNNGDLGHALNVIARISGASMPAAPVFTAANHSPTPVANTIKAEDIPF